MPTKGTALCCREVEVRDIGTGNTESRVLSSSAVDVLRRARLEGWAIFTVNEAKKNKHAFPGSEDGPAVHCSDIRGQTPWSVDKGAAGEITAQVVRALAQRKIRTRVL